MTVTGRGRHGSVEKRTLVMEDGTVIGLENIAAISGFQFEFRMGVEYITVNGRCGILDRNTCRVKRFSNLFQSQNSEDFRVLYIKFCKNKEVMVY